MKKYTDMELMMIGVNRFIYHSWNYQLSQKPVKVDGKNVIIPRFVLEVEWDCPTQHMVDKWVEATMTEDPHSYMSHFYSGLGTTNRMKLISWVMENYSDEMKFGFEDEEE